MASRRQLITAEWRRQQEGDLTRLPNVPRKLREGSFGTFPEDVRQGGPLAPTLDNGPLYTGEWREEVNGLDILVPPSVTATPQIAGGTAGSASPGQVLCTLREPWPLVGFAVDVSKFSPTDQILVGLTIPMRSGRAVLIANAVGNTLVGAQLTWTVPAAPAVKNSWIAMTGIAAGARVELWLQHNHEGNVKVRGNLWGYLPNGPMGASGKR